MSGGAVVAVRFYCNKIFILYRFMSKIDINKINTF